MPKIQGLMLEEMPREKLISSGPSNLTDVELLAIILRVGTKNKNVIELSREILSSFNVNLISRKTYYDLLGFRGVSKAKACQIVSVFELSRRLSSKGAERRIKLNNSSSVFDFVRMDFFGLSSEKVMAVFVDTKNQMICKEFVFNGTINYSIIETRDLIKKALSVDASGFFLIHNHPSGILEPSPEDIEVTNNIKSACKIFNLRFLDHLIISDVNYFSMYDSDVF